MEANLVFGSVLVFGILPVLLAALLELRRSRRELEGARAEARTDALTGALNGRAWLERVGQLQAAGAPFAFALFDLGNLKAANEALGHEGANELLRDLARQCRAGEFVGYRTGGDEFAVVLAGGRLEDARRARDRVERGFGWRRIAAGVEAFAVGEVGTWAPGQDLARQLTAADRALELRKAARKAERGLPQTRAATLELLAAAA